MRVVYAAEDVRFVTAANLMFGGEEAQRALDALTDLARPEPAEPQIRVIRRLDTKPAPERAPEPEQPKQDTDT